VTELVDEVDGVEGMRADVRDEYDVERLLETAARASSGGVDYLVPCAAVYHGEAGETPLPAESYARFDDTVRTNVRGVFSAAKEALPHMPDDGRVVVPTGSVAREPSAGYGAYAVSKAAAEGVARGLAADCEQVVGCADLGLVATELTGGKGRDPSDAADLLHWALTDADADDLDGGVVDLRDWRAATR
jgi:3-oxoacyl-[acyl-carrier protein] reductase